MEFFFPTTDILNDLFSKYAREVIADHLYDDLHGQGYSRPCFLNGM